MSFIRFQIILIFIITVNCGGNKVTNYHGVKKIETKYQKLELKNEKKGMLKKFKKLFD